MSQISTIRQVIFSPSDYLNGSTTVSGVIVLLDVSLGRMDISHDGAKMIVDVGNVTSAEGLREGSQVLVKGLVKKQQRRTFLAAEHVENISVDTKLDND